MKYTFFAANATTGVGIASLSPVWTGSPATLYKFEDASPAIVDSTVPAITEVGGSGNGGGFYVFDTGVYAGLNLCGTIDLTASGPSGAGRYLKVVISGSNASIMPMISDRIVQAAAGGGGSGTVTSVAATVPSVLSISGSPITTTGTLAISYSGTALPIANGGTAATSAGAALTSLGAAPLASPTFTGTPSLPTGTTATTQTAGDSTTKLATTAFVATSFAPLASPTFSGTPSLPTGTTATTQTAGDNSTKLATTAYIDRVAVSLAYIASTGQGLYYPTSMASGTSTSATLGGATAGLRVWPFFIPRAVTITRMGAEVVTGTTADTGTKLRMGIYSDNGVGYPGALLLDAGQVDGVTIQYVEATVSQVLGPGLFWFGFVVQANVTTQPTIRINSNMPSVVGTPTTPITPLSAVYSYLWPSQSGALTGPFPAIGVSSVAANATVPRVMIKVT